MQNLNAYLETHKERFIEELIELLKIPSVSADSAFSQDVVDAAHSVAASLEKAGCEEVEVCETDGYPIVYGEKILSPDLPTVLVYGHYDVQPPDPLDLWHTPPFEPMIKKTPLHPDGAIYARGASDDKGQMYMHIKALEYMVSHEALPCNVKFMIEGEEEVGSSSLDAFVKENRSKLANDVILISDTSMIAPDIPSITTGLRGLSYVEVSVTGPNRDLHSGLYGGAVANPINILAKMIASLHDDENRITIPGFYDKVQSLPAAEREALSEAPFDLESYKRELDISAVYGEAGFSTTERNSIRPTLDVNGIWGGYTGEGAKTVIPAAAHAKISMRLVPDQDWKEITAMFSEHFKLIAPAGVQVTIKPHHGGYAYVTPMDHIGYQAASKALEQTFGKIPVPQRGGGSIPIVSLFEKELESKSILMGFGFDSDALHSPNEHYGIRNYLKGIETIPYFYKYYSELAS